MHNWSPQAPGSGHSGGGLGGGGGLSGGSLSGGGLSGGGLSGGRSSLSKPAQSLGGGSLSSGGGSLSGGSLSGDGLNGGMVFSGENGSATAMSLNSDQVSPIEEQQQPQQEEETFYEPEPPAPYVAPVPKWEPQTPDQASMQGILVELMDKAHATKLQPFYDGPFERQERSVLSLNELKE